MAEPVTIYYLEMRELSWLRPSAAPTVEVELRSIDPPVPQLNRTLYRQIGADWRWFDRLPWTEAQWTAWLERPEVETWVLYCDDEPAGYFELERQSGGDVEIVYFGLRPEFLGMRLGGYLLNEAVRRALQIGKRVWLHTCSLDHPAALANYKARGFRLYRQESS